MILMVIFVSSTVCIFINILWKWSKALLVMILLESITAISLSLLFSYNLGGYFCLLLLSFFVSEALILLSSFYSVLRNSGTTSSSLIFF